MQVQKVSETEEGKEDVSYNMDQRSGSKRGNQGTDRREKKVQKRLCTREHPSRKTRGPSPYHGKTTQRDFGE